MSIKELFKKVDKLNSLQNELGLQEKPCVVEIQFEYNSIGFKTFKELKDYMKEVYVEYFVNKFLEAEIIGNEICVRNEERKIPFSIIREE